MCPCCNPDTYSQFFLQNRHPYFEKHASSFPLPGGAAFLLAWAASPAAVSAEGSVSVLPQLDFKTGPQRCTVVWCLTVSSTCWDRCLSFISLAPDALVQEGQPAVGQWQTGWERSDSICTHHSAFPCWRDSGCWCGFSKNPSDLLTQLILSGFPEVFRACDSFQKMLFI